MAIVKANYTKSRAKIKASVRYIQHRPGQDGERLTRQLFGPNGAMTRDEAYQLIDQAAKGTRFYRLVLSPDPACEDTEKDLNLQELTRQTLSQLSDKLGKPIQYIGAIHNDHRPHRHVHIVMLVQGGLNREDFRLLREHATEASLMQRRELDAARGAAAAARARAPIRQHHELGRQSAGSTGGYIATGTIRCPVCNQENCPGHDSGLGRG